jgi:hypothetical protein
MALVNSCLTTDDDSHCHESEEMAKYEKMHLDVVRIEAHESKSDRLKSMLVACVRFCFSSVRSLTSYKYYPHAYETKGWPLKTARRRRCLYTARIYERQYIVLYNTTMDGLNTKRDICDGGEVCKFYCYLQCRTPAACARVLPKIILAESVQIHTFLAARASVRHDTSRHTANQRNIEEDMMIVPRFARSAGTLRFSLADFVHRSHMQAKHKSFRTMLSCGTADFACR